MGEKYFSSKLVVRCLGKHHAIYLIVLYNILACPLGGEGDTVTASQHLCSVLSLYWALFPVLLHSLQLS